MTYQILLTEKPIKEFLLGNEAIVRGAIEAGVEFAASYPGTPASEIGNILSILAKEVGIYFEWSVNEKVAVETAGAASFCGLASMASMKHFGANVASDSLLPIAYVGTRGGMVVIIADDPQGWSSAQSEQDSRHYPRMGKIPTLEPSTPQECKDCVVEAFRISKKYEIPVILRTTTRVSHSRGIVEFAPLRKRKKGEAKFVKDERYNTLPPNVLRLHERILQKLERVKGEFERSRLNFVESFAGKRPTIGIITSGTSFNYVMEAVRELNLSARVLKLTTTHPLPSKLIVRFLKNFKEVLVVEELDPVLESEVKRIAQENGIKTKIRGKDLVPEVGELTPEKVCEAVAKFSRRKPRFSYEAHLKSFERVRKNLPARFPVMCPGCPYRPLFFAVKKACEELGEDVAFCGDIGCYMLGVFPPYEVEDVILCMGAGEGIAHGISKSSKQKTIAFVGDSTFFHAGIPALINMVFNKSSPLVMILDNETTAMTGHQTHPGVGMTAMGEETKKVSIERLVSSLGIENVKVIDPYNIEEVRKTVKEFLTSGKLSVIVARRECRLKFVRRAKKQGIAIPKFRVNQEKCNKCGVCVREFACPAIYEDEEGNYRIDEQVCNGCGVCVQACPQRAIEVVRDEGKG